MKKTALVLAAVMVFGMFGCSSGKQELYVYNWGANIDPEINKMFEEEFNCRIIYETYDSNESMYVKVKQGSNSYDVIFPSDYMIEKMIKEDMLHEINKENIPNIANIQPYLLNREFDPGNKYSVPYFWGTFGILYNTEMVEGPVESWSVLWDEKYSKQILMYDSQRDSLGLALKYLGYSMNSRDPKELKEAEELLIKQRPLVLAYYTDQIMEMMMGEEAAIGVVYSGDAVFAMYENDKLAYAVPKEGSNVWFDSTAIPKTAKNKELAEQYINFLCRDEISRMNTEEVMYSTANKNLEAELRGSDWANNDTYFPTEEILKRCEIFKDPGDFIDAYSDAWERVRGSGSN